MLAQANAQVTKDQLKAVTVRAVECGVFGAPTFFVGEQMFWGQDRVEQVIAALKANFLNWLDALQQASATASGTAAARSSS